MRRFASILFYILFVNVIAVFVQNTLAYAAEGAPKDTTPTKTETDKECQPADLAIVGKKQGDDFCFKMGESMRIKATGGCFDKIKTALARADAVKTFRLYLDDIPMAGLNMSVSQVTGERELILSFLLTRRPYEEDNRKAWDMLFKKETGGYVMTLPVALGVFSEPAWTVQSASPFQLYIAKDASVWGTLAIGVLIFGVSYYLLMKSPSALRDMKGGCYSLGKSQMAFWGLVVVLTFAGIWVLSGTMERIPAQVLSLLGISGATGLSAIVIRENKKSGADAERETKLTALRDELQKLQKEKLTAAAAFPSASDDRLVRIKSDIDDLSKPPPPPTSNGFWRDICDDGNGLSFHRLQVVIWTGVLGVVFVVSVLDAMSMPEFSESLLVLLGISNGIYLGFKFPEKA